MKTSTPFPRGPQPDKRPGAREAMTLIELLVVVSILVLLAAIAVPQLKPALESQQSRSVAQSVGVMIQRARLQAIEKRMPLGVRFERYRDADDTTGTNSDACVTLRILKSASASPGTKLGPNEGVYVIDGEVFFYEYRDSSGTGTFQWELKGSDFMRLADVSGLVQVGGRYCQAEKVFDANRNLTDVILRDPYGNTIDYPVKGLASAPDPVPLGDEYTNTIDGKTRTGYYTAPQPFFVFSTSRAQPSLAAPTTLPLGCVVDLRWSGTTNTKGNLCTAAGCFRNYPADITLMFSSDGSVERIFFGNDIDYCIFPTEPIFFLVGDWDQLASHGNLKEDPRNNYELARNYWISINPRNGMVVTNEVNPIQPVDRDIPTAAEMRDARKFAYDFNINYGGF